MISKQDDFNEYQKKMNELESIHNEFSGKIRLLERNAKSTKILNKLAYIEYKKELMIEELL